MPASKKLSKYPGHYLDLLTAQLPLFVQFETKQKAQRERFQIYGFIEAMRIAQHPQVHLLDAMQFKVDGPFLVIEHRDDPGVNPLAAALKQQTLSPSSSVPEARSAPKPSAHETVLERYLSTPPSVASEASSTDRNAAVCGWPACQCPPPAPTPCSRWQRERSEGRLSSESS